METARTFGSSIYLRPEKGVVLVGVGFKEVGGVRTARRAVVFGVVRKLPPQEIASEDMLPSTIFYAPEGEFETDVIEVGEIKALRTTRQRPVKGGWSVGHRDITAGTLGAWVFRGPGTQPHILSNNHVLANENRAQIGDPIYQPGPRDGGTPPENLIARLTEYVAIRFGGGMPGKKKKAIWLWRVATGIPNAIAKIVGCDYRSRRYLPGVVDQSRNFVDAAIAAVIDPTDADFEIDGIGRLVGVRDFVVGEQVRKSGRTTGLTQATVTLERADVSVQYDGGVVNFVDQFVINGGGFSAPGDSGSVIVTPDNHLGGLLFAGSETTTIANRASHVVALLGIRVS